MCGIFGTWSKQPDQNEAELEHITQCCTETMHHRGPDDSGVWIDAHSGIGLGHRRLSIIDTSKHGSQPMQSSSGRYILTYNGELYNAAELREQLNVSWRGHSDTEILLAAIEAWGLADSLKRCNGMFAFGLWDTKTKTLYLARDRVGEKPLYYCENNGLFLFASELKALKKHPEWHGEIDRNILTSYFRYNYVPSPHTIFKNVHKLQPGHYLTLNNNHTATLTAYWNLGNMAVKSYQNPLDISDEDAVNQLDSIVRKSVKRRMVSDVPLGAFLSGGIDSSILVALMQAESSSAIKSFTIGFEQAGYNEAEFAKAVAKHLGTKHTEFYVTDKQAQDIVSHLPNMYDEPFADASQIATYLVASMAKQHVTVALSGDGADELFGGYNRYFHGPSLWQKMRWAPAPVRRLIANSITAIPISTWDSIASSRTGENLHKFASLITAESKEALYHNAISQWDDPGQLVINGDETAGLPNLNSQLSFTHQMMLADMETYLPDDILVKLDRASMATSLETRIPFLDPELMQFAWQLPQHQKIRHNGGKWILKELLSRYVPRTLTDRPKTGFSVPIDSWLRGPLRDWAEQLIEPTRLRQEGYLNANIVQHFWQQHLSGKRNWQYRLWGILMFQSWLEQQIL